MAVRAVCFSGSAVGSGPSGVRAGQQSCPICDPLARPATPVKRATLQVHSAAWPRGQLSPGAKGPATIRPAFASGTMPRTTEVTFEGACTLGTCARCCHLLYVVYVRSPFLPIKPAVSHSIVPYQLPPTHTQSESEVHFSTARAESLFRAESLLLGPAPRVSMADGISLRPGSALGGMPVAEGRGAGGTLSQTSTLGFISRPSVGGGGAPQSNALLPGYSSSFGPEAPSRFCRSGALDMPQQRGTDAVQVGEVWGGWVLFRGAVRLPSQGHGRGADMSPIHTSVDICHMQCMDRRI